MVRARGNRSSSAHTSHSAPRAAPAAAPQQQQPKVTNIYVQQQPRMGGMGMGGGGGSGMLGTMAAVAGGSVIGHGISHMLFNKSEPITEPQQVHEVAKAYEGTQCQPLISTYEKCLTATGGNAEQCKYVWESFMECQEKVPKA